MSPPNADTKREILNRRGKRQEVYEARSERLEQRRFDLAAPLLVELDGLLSKARDV